MTSRSRACAFVTVLLATGLQSSGWSAVTGESVLREDGFIQDPAIQAGLIPGPSVRPPTVRGSNALAAVQEFTRTNGWHMETHEPFVLGYSSSRFRPISGLPWSSLQDRQFSAATHDGVLYVLLTGWHHYATGLAYNPHTNAFPKSIGAFRHVGDHWYVWKVGDDSGRPGIVRGYEGATNAAANKSRQATPDRRPVQRRRPRSGVPALGRWTGHLGRWANHRIRV
jgi:hypothetical protein